MILILMKINSRSGNLSKKSIKNKWNNQLDLILKIKIDLKIRERSLPIKQ